MRARPLPVVLQPRDFSALLGRERDVAEALAALGGNEPVTLAGPAGIGKTSLLRSLAHVARGTVDDSVVFLRAAGQPREDVERFLFDAFYTSDAPYQPTPFELRERLADRSALVILDDVEQERDDVCELLDCAPACRFLLAGERRELWGEGRALELDGLDEAAALALLERELGRPLRDDERARAGDLCRRVGGRPLSILQAAALARAGELPLGAPGELEESLRASLDDEDRRVLHALQLLAPAAVHIDDVAAIAAVPDAGTVLERLRARGAAQAHSPRWSATLTMRIGGGDEDEALLLRRARERLAAGADERPVEDVPAILAALGAGDDSPADRRGALALAVAVDALLTRSGRWGAWAVALECARAAAEAGGNRAATAWALHQLGTRAGCLGDRAGVARLQRALALRRELGDEVGAAVSAHNLARLYGGMPGRGGQRGKKPKDRSPGTGRWLALGGGMLALGVVAALLLSSSQSSKPVAAAISQTQTSVTTVPSGTTVAPTPTPTPTPTPAGAPALSITGKLHYVAPDVGGTDSGTVTVTDLGPGPVAIAASVDSAQFVLAPRCPDTLEVGQGCVIAITYRADQGIRSATLRFAGSPTTARLDGMPSATSSRGGRQPPVVPPQGVATQTTTTTAASPAASSGDEGVVR